MPIYVRFWLFLTALIPSVICSIAVLFHILSNRNRRTAIHNHFIIILLINNLIYELIDVPLLLNYDRLGTVWPASEIFCVIWMFIDEALSSVSTVVVAWTSLERHMLIFHKQWFATVRGRVLLHYTPLVLLISYIILFHTFAILIPPCKNVFDYTEEICGRPLCYHNSKIIGTWDNIVNDIIPTIIVVMFSVSLLGRVIIKGRQIGRALQWRKHRKMAIQLLSVSGLYFFLYIPNMFIDLIHLCCVHENYSPDYERYVEFFSYYVIFILPFVCLGSLIQKAWQPNRCFPFRLRTTQEIHPQTPNPINIIVKPANNAKTTTRD